MGSISPEKILVILLVALIVLGPQKLPQMGRQAGKLWNDLRRLRENLEGEVRGAFGDEGDGSSPLRYVQDTVRGTFDAAPRPASASDAAPADPAPQAPAADHGDGSLDEAPVPAARTWLPHDEAAVPADDPGFN